MRIHAPRHLLALALFLAVPAFATDGYFSIGYGVKQVGQGGAGVALPQDSLAAASNPAGMVLVGDRLDLGLTWFRPIRDASISGSANPQLDLTDDGSRKKNFFIPELGYNHRLIPRLSLGVSIYGNGGMNTAYTTAIPLFSANPSFRAGVDLQQLFVSPAVAFQANSHNAFGVALNIGYQKFAAQGLEDFEAPGFSSSPGNVTELGFSNSFGAGVRLGWLGTITQSLSLGATFQTRTIMQKLDKYKGLFAERGGFDIPANVAGGVSFKIVRKATVLFDVERIFYGQVNSIAEPDFPNPAIQLGANNGPGFGWHDINAEKLGFDFKLRPALTLRAGFNHSGLPFDASQNLFNILAPAVVQNHLTAGATWRLGSGKRARGQYCVSARLSEYPGWRALDPSSLRRRRGQPAHVSGRSEHQRRMGEVN
ncbi:MAG: outer membrane protein transport protein [Terriglobales bacterium]|jgi:long-chain fatty acid transport protein